MSVTVTARVVGVRPRGDGTFGVTLGPGPRVWWLRTRKPPKLGELVVVDGAEATSMKVGANSVVTMLEGGDLSTKEDPFQRRVVAPAWVRRVHQIVRRPLMPFQAEGAGWLAARLVAGKGSLLGDSPGCGKSVQVLAAIAVTGATPAIIVCPPSVKRNWGREAKFLKPKLKVTVLNGSRGPIEPAHIIVMNYAILKGREHQLARLRARTIILDEVHLCKEPQPVSSHRAAVATRVVKRIGRPILLTGTPLLNRPQELWRLLHMMDPLSWPSFAEFRRRYCTTPGIDERHSAVVTDHGQAKNLDELRALAMPYVMRRLAKRVLSNELPPKTRRRVLVQLEEVDRKHYDAAEKDVVAWLHEIAGAGRAASAKRGQAVVKLNMLRRIAAIGKLRRGVGDYVRIWFDQYDRPLVIFAYHKAVLTGTEEICRRLGLKIATIKGSDNDTKRQNAVDRFQGGKADVFIAPIKSAGVGINLQRGSDILCLERLWTPALMNQAEGRCWRMGQKSPVTVTYLDAMGTVDEHIAKVLESKQVLIDRVIDDLKRDHTQGRIETIDEVIEQVRQQQMRKMWQEQRRRAASAVVRR